MAAATLEKHCTFLVATEPHPPSPTEIKNALENGDDDERRDALRAALAALVSGGDPVPGLFITIVRYVLPSEDHFTQKLLLLYLVGGGMGSKLFFACAHRACVRARRPRCTHSPRPFPLLRKPSRRRMRRASCCLRW